MMADSMQIDIDAKSGKRGVRIARTNDGGFVTKKGFDRSKMKQHRGNPYQPSNRADGTWKHDLFQERGALRKPRHTNTFKATPSPSLVGSSVFQRLGGIAGAASAAANPVQRGPATLLISNLHLDATVEDIKTCFSEFGRITTATLKTDPFTKKSLGTCEITYSQRDDAMKAIERYNQQMADGRLLTVIEIPNANTTSILGAASSQPVMQHSQPKPKVSLGRSMVADLVERAGAPVIKATVPNKKSRSVMERLGSKPSNVRGRGGSSAAMDTVPTKFTVTL